MNYNWPWAKLASGILGITLGGALLGGCVVRTQPARTRTVVVHERPPPPARTVIVRERPPPADTIIIRDRRPPPRRDRW
jgi:hypothetical protein